jgi:hypothetical protein
LAEYAEAIASLASLHQSVGCPDVVVWSGDLREYPFSAVFRAQLGADEYERAVAEDPGGHVVLDREAAAGILDDAFPEQAAAVRERPAPGRFTLIVLVERELSILEFGY